MINKSKQRDAILKVLMSTKSHPTAEWLHEEVKKEIPNISLATVYRNLGQLIDNGMAIKVQGIFDKDRYDGNANRHSHLVCSECGSVVDLDISESLDRDIIRISTSCYINDYSLTFHGLCPKCIDKHN